MTAATEAVRVFINYRSDGAEAEAGRLRDRIASDLGTEKVFFAPIAGALRPGTVFYPALERNMASAEVMLAVIHPEWLEQIQAHQEADTRDYVVEEIAFAIAFGKQVIPVLVGGALMPDERALPTAIRALAEQHAAVLSTRTYDHDYALLIAQVERVLNRAVPSPDVATAAEQRPTLMRSAFGLPVNPTTHVIPPARSQGRPVSLERGVATLQAKLGLSNRGDRYELDKLIAKARSAQHANTDPLPQLLKEVVASSKYEPRKPKGLAESERTTQAPATLDDNE